MPPVSSLSGPRSARDVHMPRHPARVHWHAGGETEGFFIPEAMASGMSGPLLEARGLFKSYGRNQVLKGVDLSLFEGDRYFLFGPNGAGKTTLVRVLTGLTGTDSGEVLVSGRPVDRDDDDTRARIGVLSHEPYLYGELSALENLEFFGSLYRVPDVGARARGMLKEVGLHARAHDRVDTLSRGTRQRLGLARALLHDPDLVFLDEPYTGLDLGAVETLERMLRALSEAGRAVLVITHDPGHGPGMATRAGMLVEGRIGTESGPEGWDDLTRRYRALFGGVP